MNPREPLTPEEQVLAARLQEWSSGGPSAELDAAILAQARTAVATTPRRSRRPWAISMASAAALVLTVSVVWRTLQSPQNEEVLAPPTTPTMRASDDRQAPPAVLDRADSEAKMTPETSAIPPGQANQETSAGVAGVPARAALEEAGDSHDRAAVPRAVDDTLTPPPPAEPAPAPAAPPSSMPYTEAAPSSATGQSPRLEAPVPVPEPLSAPERARDDIVGESRRERQQPAAPPAATQSESMASEPALDRAPEPDAFAQAIENIRAQLREGETEAARKAIVELRRRFPDRPLPPDIAQAARAFDSGH